jgi:phosphoribosylformylglycinamidine cyclo-ligase
LVENIPRVLSENIDAVIDPQTWSFPPIFAWLQEHGNVALNEIYRTFNCGIGMVISVADEQKMDAIKQLTQSGETAWLLGHLAESTGDRSTVRFASL